MDKIHKILNYSFAPIDILNYVDRFTSARREDMKRFPVDCECNDVRYDKPDEIASAVYGMYFKEAIKNPDPLDGFNTYEMLGAIIWEISKTGICSGREKIINALQKKFEVNHRVFDSYDFAITKNSDSYRSVPVYAMLSIVLSLRYLIERNLNDFNTAVKLNDLLLKSGWVIDTSYNYAVWVSLCLESRIIEELNGC